ncbi:MAG: hypothetical protein GY856_34645, partial [bacterium]|nr:hypothetical protein [bacterium]
MKFLLIIPDGVGIRNFLCTPFIDQLLDRGGVTVWHALSEGTLAAHRPRWGDAVGWQPLPGFREGLRERILREAKIFAQLYWRHDRDAGDVQLRFRRPRGRWVTRLVTVAARTLGRLRASPQGFLWLEQRHRDATLGADHFRAFAEFL